jgi:CRISPR-associated protein Cas1
MLQTTLYVTESRAVIRRAGGSLVVTKDEDPDGPGPLPERRVVRIEVEPHRLESVVIVGQAHITSEALYFCLENGIMVSWFSWNGRLLGRLAPPTPLAGDLRLLQYRLALDPAERLALARRTVEAKLYNAAETLENIQGNHASETLPSAIATLRQLAQSAAQAQSIESLLGTEGSGSRAYFQSLAADGFRADITFQTRRRQPPPDPANALLSFGYVLLGNRLAALAEARGLDPAVGFYHEPRAGRPSLALDLLEEFRHPVVDRVVMRLANLRILKPADFEPDPQSPEDAGDGGGRAGVRLRSESAKIFFREWRAALAKPLRDAIAGERVPAEELLRRQVERLAAALRAAKPYQPFRFGD